MLKTDFDGRFWLNVEGHAFAGGGRITLLERVQETGSISAAARTMGMSYKAAWDAIDAMNNLADQPLLLRQAGGRHGGGTKITAHGERVIRQYRQVEATHQRFLQALSTASGEIGDTWSLMKRLAMNTSARNHLLGSVTELHRGVVSDEVVVDIGQSLRIHCSITRESSDSLGLDQPNRRVHVLIKAPFVMLAEPAAGRGYSASNQFVGEVAEITPGAVQSEARVEIGPGRTLIAVVPRQATEQDWLQPGRSVVALINPSHIVLATSD